MDLSPDICLMCQLPIDPYKLGDTICPACLEDGLSPKAIRLMVCCIESRNSEQAHILEDKIHTVTLKAIAASKAYMPRECAIEALRTLELDFQRWHS